MREAFTKEARRAVERAETEARRRARARSRPSTCCSRSATTSAWTGPRSPHALAAEWRASLDAAGVDLVPPPPRPRRGRLRFGASAKQALERSLRVAMERHDRAITARHVALGVLRAEHGTAPRALRLAGIDVSVLDD